MRDKFIIIKIEDQLKEEFKKPLEAEGMTMSGWFRVQIMKKINSNHRL